MRRPSTEHHLVVVLAVSFGLTILSFIASRLISETVSRRTEAEVQSIGQNALLATEALVDARTDLRKLLFTMAALRASDDTGVAAGELAGELAAARRALAADWGKYRSIPYYPGENRLAEPAARDVDDAGRAADDMGERLDRGDRAGALRLGRERALPATERADGDLGRLIQFNGKEAQNAAQRILATRRPWGILPELLGAFFALAAAWTGVRVLRKYLAWATERSAELEQFAGRVAHDIRSPLGSATLALDVAQRGKDVDPRTRQLLARASRTMDRIGKLVDGLLVFASSGGYLVPGGLGEPSTSTGEVLDGLVDDLRMEAEAKHIDLEYEPADPRLAVACSPGVLISMVTNLVSNAIKYMGDAVIRRITVRVRPVGRDVEVAVSDTGPGIAPALRDKVFSPYVRGTTAVPGYGLGLATVRKLAEAHGGHVGVESTLGEGTTFFVTVPKADQAPGLRAV